MQLRPPCPWPGVGATSFLICLRRTSSLVSILLFVAVSCLQITYAFAKPRAEFEVRRVLQKSQDTETVVSQNITSLRLGETVTQQIKGGEVHSFKVSLTAGQYARLLVEQHGIILVATLSDFDGKQIVEMDNPSGGHGPIYISFIATASGDFRLELRSIEDWANPGHYEVLIEELREAAPADRERVNAEMAFAEGRQLVNKGTKDSRLGAIKQYEEALAYWSRAQDAHWQALTLYAIARTYRSLGQSQTAADYFEKMLPLQLSDHDWRLRASLFNDRGLNYSDLGKPELALDSLDRAFELYQAHQDKRGQASVFNNIGLTYHRIGALREALENYAKAIPLRQSENDQQGEFNIRNNIAGVYDVSGEPLRARDQYEATLTVWQKLDKSGELRDRNQLGSSYNNVGEAENKLGEWQQAYDNYQQALAVFQKTGNSQREAACLDNIGQLYQDLGEAELALKHFKQAHALLQDKVKDPDLEANVLSHIGTTNLLLGNLDEALQDFQRAFALRQSPRGQGYALINLGAAHLLQNNPQKALEVFDKALTLLRSSGDRQGEAVTLYKRGEAYHLLRNHSRALDEFSRALLVWKSIANRRGEATTLLGIALAEEDLNKLEEAVKHNEAALAIIESLRTNISSSRLRSSYFATQQNYYESNAELNMRLYQQDHSPQRLGAALQVSERSRARTLIDTLNDARVDIAKGLSEDLLNREREIQQTLTAKSEAQTRLLGSKHSAQQADTIANEIIELITEDRNLRDTIRISSPKYAHLTQPQPLTLPETQQQLDGETILLEYSLGDKRSYVWAVTPDSIKGFELEGRKEIEATAERMIKAITQRNRRGVNDSPQQVDLHRIQADAKYAEASAELSKMVIQPVAALLGNKRLVIVPDGALQLVPFQALPNPQTVDPANGNTARSKNSRKAGAGNDRRLLVEDHEIVYEASASVLAVQRKEFGRRQPARRALAVLADPVFDQEGLKRELGLRRAAKTRDRQAQPSADSSGSSSGSNTGSRSDLTRAIDDIGIGAISSLPQSREEAEAIMNVVPKGEGMAALGFDASRAMVMGTDLSQYRIIHFATHGFADLNHPELSGIVLSLVDAKGQPQDGYLRLHEIYNLNLPADLVVLSACQTGIGKQIKGEGLIALTRGFTYAGAARVVASLWKVDDEATRDLMEEFYKQMFINKLKPAAALRKAQINLSHQSQWRSPYYWAGFVLQGEWK